MAELKSYFLRNIEVKHGLVLAPMSGVTTSAFRRLVKELNPAAVGLVMTEFISVEGLTRESVRSREMLKFNRAEHPVAIQIFGYDVDRLTLAAKMVEATGADIVDLNCGCPAPKVVKKGGGCELMRQPEHLRRIIRSIRKAVNIPFTIKIRSGWDEQSKNALEIALMAESEGVEALAVHGRTRAQLYRGAADWDLVSDISNRLKIPVLGSGDVSDREGALLRRALPISGVLIGRAALYNPLVFGEIVSGEKANLRSRPDLMLNIMERYIALLREDFPDRACTGKVKQLASQMCRGQEWRKAICTANNMDQIEALLKRAKDLFGVSSAVHAGVKFHQLDRFKSSSNQESEKGAVCSA